MAKTAWITDLATADLAKLRLEKGVAVSRARSSSAFARVIARAVKTTMKDMVAEMVDAPLARRVQA
jgi:hypothetical protein